MPKKPKLGQNFLVDQSACRAIVAALGRDLSQSTVVEIGPGGGALTDLLALRAGRLIAVELDRYLAAAIGARFSAQPSVEVLQQDVLTVDLSSLRSEDAPPLIVVGNLPYYITSDILLHLFRHHRAVQTAVLMMQKEVADRIAAAPGSRDYGMLTVTTQLYAQAERLMTLPPEAFSPPPEVQSTVLRLTMGPQFEQLGIDPDSFVRFLRQCFAQKRKTLRNNLRAAGLKNPAWESHLARAAISSEARAEELTLGQLAALWHALHPS